MTIDRALEPHVSFAPVLPGASDRLDRALAAIADRSDDLARTAVSLAGDGAALCTIHECQRPDIEQPVYLADGLTQDATERALGAGGWLMSAFISDDGEWTDFLDRILTVLESPEGNDSARC